MVYIKTTCIKNVHLAFYKDRDLPAEICQLSSPLIYAQLAAKEGEEGMSCLFPVWRGEMAKTRVLEHNLQFATNVLVKKNRPDSIMDAFSLSILWILSLTWP